MFLVEILSQQGIITGDGGGDWFIERGLTSNHCESVSTRRNNAGHCHLIHILFTITITSKRTRQ